MRRRARDSVGDSVFGTGVGLGGSGFLVEGIAGVVEVNDLGWLDNLVFATVAGICGGVFCRPSKVFCRKSQARVMA